jgi:tRNA(Ile2)-agmatinylcytidine synthase
MVHLYIGLDDTDSPNGGCTTHIVALLVQKISDMGISFIDYPNLIRLNPNVPWKTRGNGALCLRIICKKSDLEQIKEIVIHTVEKNSKLNYEGTDPGIVFISESIPGEVKNFAQKAEHRILKIDEALKLVKRISADIVGFKKGRGIIGALAAIG